MVISGVFDLADGAVRLDQGIESMDSIAIAGFVLRLVVTGVRVSHGVSEVVFGVGLENLTSSRSWRYDFRIVLRLCLLKKGQLSGKIYSIKDFSRHFFIIIYIILSFT